MKNLNADNLDIQMTNTHYKNMKTEVIDNKSPAHSID